MQSKPLIIGYGNVDRQDDGLAWHILAKTAKLCGVESLLDPYSDEKIETPAADFLFMLQLEPETAEIFAEYPRVCFVDACVYPPENGFKIETIYPEYQPSPMTHHMTPETCLAICESIFQKKPQAEILSVAAYEFDFSNALSNQTQAHLAPAVRALLDWIKNSSSLRPVQEAEMQI